MNTSKVFVVMTCFNRKEYTTKCIKTMAEGNPAIHFSFVVVDDASTDGTAEALFEMKQDIQLDIKVIRGNGNLFWNGGMHQGLEYVLNSQEEYDYCMLVNDDVVFTDHALERLIARQQSNPGSVVVGATQDGNDVMSYGGVKCLSKHRAKFSLMEPSAEIRECDTFNGNCVLIARDLLQQIGNVDPHYIHSMSDYDYGMHIRRIGIPIINSEDFVGICRDNDVDGSWRDPKIPRWDRVKRKESPKGLPFKDWFYFIYKNYGVLNAVYHSATPYLRILLKR
ncbi:MAG: glycosyltransferase family 2 protein [Lachnospiraceae bacterium]|nr:glycosyltransferase family 2 protein [Lachnospiraceae bacterium]